MKTTRALWVPVLLVSLGAGMCLAQPHLDLTYSGYLGGTNSEQAFGVCVDADGNAYITGETRSIDFPRTTSPTAHFGGGTDVFVTKLNPLGAIVYSTYFGGSGNDTGRRIAVDREGNAYITGYTASTNFPTVHAFQTNYGGGGYDCFLAKLDPSGSTLVYSTYLGGRGSEAAGGIAMDLAGNAYITGWTDSNNFPTTNAFQSRLGGGKDAFIAKVGANGSDLIYSTFLGGSGDDNVFYLTTALGGVAVDQQGNAYVTGNTYSTDLPTTTNAFQRKLRGDRDCFVSKLNSAGLALVYSTYLGGFDTDGARDIAVDSNGNAYVAGETYSPDFPVANAFQAALKGSTYNAFVTKLNAAGSALVYSTFLGGQEGDFGGGFGITVDSLGNAYITGVTAARNFPTLNAWQPTYRGGTYDCFVTAFNASGSALIYSTYLGGNGDEWPWGIARGPSGDTFVVGYTQSTNFPTVGPVQAARRGSQDGFVAKIVLTPTLTFNRRSTAEFEFGMVGPVGQTVLLQGSTNLSDWVPLVTLTNLTGSISFRDFEIESVNLSRRFYRAVLSSP